MLIIILAMRKEQGHLEDARACYEHRVRLKPDFAEAYNNLGNVKRELGRLDEAAANCRTALRLKPDMADGHNNLGAVYSAQRRWPDAAAAFRQALALRPDHAEAHGNLGAALRELGEIEEAVLHLRQAVRLEAQLRRGSWRLAMALSNRATWTALASCEQALTAASRAGVGAFEHGLRSCGAWPVRAVAGLLRSRWQSSRICPTRTKPLVDLAASRQTVGGLGGSNGVGNARNCPSGRFHSRFGTAHRWPDAPFCCMPNRAWATRCSSFATLRWSENVGPVVAVVCQRPLVSLIGRCPGVALVVGETRCRGSTLTLRY